MPVCWHSSARAEWQVWSRQIANRYTRCQPVPAGDTSENQFARTADQFRLLAVVNLARMEVKKVALIPAGHEYPLTGSPEYSSNNRFEATTSVMQHLVTQKAK